MKNPVSQAIPNHPVSPATPNPRPDKRGEEVETSSPNSALEQDVRLKALASENAGNGAPAAENIVMNDNT